MKSLDIYLLGICGTGVGSLAGLLKELGHRVRGSDEHVYPPMSDKLREWGIEVLEGYDAAHLDPPPDLVIVGNVIRVHNPEAAFARQHNLPTLSMPEAIAHLVLGSRHSVVVAGTHGKTSVTALAAHVALQAGLDPGFLVGGALLGYRETFRSGGGHLFIIEGDEYDTAYFDKEAKFLHYRPRTVVITSLEFDHADIFDSIADVERAFRALVGRVPADGHLVVWHGAERARRLIAKHARTCRATVYSETPQPDAHLWLARYESGPAGLVFEPVERGESLGEMRVPLWGAFSARNVLAVIGALRGLGVSAAALRRGMSTFAGVRRRLEVLGEPRGVTVVDDFGHHPTAVRETLAAARSRWPGRRLWAVLEPRSATSRRNVFHSEFSEALATADRVVIGTHARLEEVPVPERLDPGALASAIAERGIPSLFEPDVRIMAERIARDAVAGDVVLIFSNGSFGGLHGELLEQLKEDG